MTSEHHAEQLRGEVLAYWKVLSLMAEMARKRRTPGLDAYFQRQLAQRRQTMLSIADEIEAGLKRELKAGDAEVAEMYRRFRPILGLAMALLLGLGLVLAAGTYRRLVRLEHEARALSAQLVRAHEEERRAIARELHDDIGQALSGLLLDLGNAASMADSEAIRSRLNSISALAERTVEEVRRIALSLRPSMLDDLGLVPALEWQARDVGHRTGIHVQVVADENAEELPDAHRTCIYRVVQKALHNCARQQLPASLECLYRRDPPRQHPRKTQPPWDRGCDSVRGSQSDHPLI